MYGQMGDDETMQCENAALDGECCEEKRRGRGRRGNMVQTQPLLVKGSCAMAARQRQGRDVGKSLR